MAEVDTLVLTDILHPYAQLMQGPPILPSEDTMGQLRDYYHARDHEDFHQPDGYEPWGAGIDKERYLILPFSLALGLHPYTSGSINNAALVETFDAYASQRSLFRTVSPRAEQDSQRTRATAVLSAAILNAVVNPRTEFSTRSKVTRAIEVSEKSKLLTRKGAKILGAASVLAHI